MWTSREKAIHISILEMKAFQLALNAFVHQIMGKSIALMSSNVILLTYIKKKKKKKTGRHSFSGHVQASLESCQLDRAADDLSHCQVHPGEEKHAGGSVEPVRPGPFHRVERRVTRGSLSVNNLPFSPTRFHSSQCSRCFIPAATKL